MTSPIRSASILIPTWQGMEFLERVFDALAAQVWERPFDVHVVDSGSTDGTWEYLQERAQNFAAPFSLRRIHPVEFDHGDTRNSLAARSKGDLLVFLTQDAIPSGPAWLATLAANFDDGQVGAAYCRNLPRPDARPLTKLQSAQDPGYAKERREVRLPDAATYAGLDCHAKRLLYNFNDVASAIRRELWERCPFPRTWFGEDVLMARSLLEAGWTVVYDAAATVEHSHDYDPAETRSRAEIDARFNAEWLDRVCVGSAKDATILTQRLGAEDAAALAKLDLDSASRQQLEQESHALRKAAFEGLFEGGRSKRRYPSSGLLEDRTLNLLYVVHGFPPDTWAGTEVYTLNLAREMSARGHRVTIMTRVPAETGGRARPDFSIEETEFEGLTVLRMTHRLEHRRLSDSFDQPKAEVAFRGVLARLQPDLVHFQHLIHTSAGLVQVAKDAGLATVITCHDFWALCSRVQMIRPGGAICPSNMGSGCFLCIKEKGLEHVERAKKLDQTLGAGKVLGALASKFADWVPSWGSAGNGGGEAGAGAKRRAQEYRDLRAREQAVPAAYAAADLRISPGRFLREMLLQSGHFDPHTFLYSENGMRTDHVRALEKRPDPDGRVRFGFVGSLVWYKGGETMIKAMVQLAERSSTPQATLAVWGSFDPESDEHHRELERLAQGAGVEFKGRFDNERLAEVYAEIDVLIVPSVWYENAPVTIREAFLTGTPVVTSNLGGMAESVRDGIDGLHFAVGDDTDLARVLARFLDEPELCEQLRQDFLPVKSVADDAADMEYRYRALCCVERVAIDAPGLLLDVSGAQAQATRGAAEIQGVEHMLLRPGAAADYALEVGDAAGLAGQRFEIEVAIRALGPEREVRLGGQVSIDGQHVGSVDVFAAQGADELRTTTISIGPLTESRGLKNMTLEASVADGDPVYLRIERVCLRRLARAESVQQLKAEGSKA